MLIHSGDFNPSVKGSSLFTETSEQAELSKLPSRSFLDASSSLDLLLKSPFFYILSKYLAISLLKNIQQEVNIKYNLYRIYFIYDMIILLGLNTCDRYATIHGKKQEGRKEMYLWPKLYCKVPPE